MEYSSKLSPDGTEIEQLRARGVCSCLLGIFVGLGDGRLCDPGAASDVSHGLTAARRHDLTDGRCWCLAGIHLFSALNHDRLKYQQCWNYFVLSCCHESLWSSGISPVIFYQRWQKRWKRAPQPTQWLLSSTEGSDIAQSHIAAANCGWKCKCSYSRSPQVMVNAFLKCFWAGRLRILSSPERVRQIES